MNYLLLQYLAIILRCTYVLFSFMYNPPFNHDTSTAVDLSFNIHALLLCAATMVLVLYYPRSLNRISRPTVTFMICSFIAVVVVAIFDTSTAVQLVGLIMFAVGSVKYIPQVKLNFKKRSTSGFSIGAIVLEIFACLFSFSEIILIKLESKTSSEIYGKVFLIMRFILIILYLGYDALFLFQHYILFVQKSIEPDESLNSSNDSLIRSAKKMAQETIQLKADYD